MNPSSRPRRTAIVDTQHCVACGSCLKVCPRQAIAIRHGVTAQIDPALCVGCGRCARECPASVIVIEEGVA